MADSIEVGVIKNPGTTIDEEKSQVIEFQQRRRWTRRMEIQAETKRTKECLGEIL